MGKDLTNQKFKYPTVWEGQVIILGKQLGGDLIKPKVKFPTLQALISFKINPNLTPFSTHCPRGIMRHTIDWSNAISD